MLAGENRLQKNSDFRTVYQKGRVYWSRFFVLRTLKRSDTGSTRFGIAPSRKIKGAVQRNKIKRRVREICHQQKNQINDGFDLVINIRRESLQVSYWELKKDLEYLFQKSSIKMITGA